jgi:NO-binding membrane sensor protein with MHYT domain
MASNMNVAGSYDLLLVALSALIAVLASYAALDFAGRVTSARRRDPRVHFLLRQFPLSV